MITKLYQQNSYLIYDNALIDEQKIDILQMFNSNYWHEQLAIIGKAHGRGTTWFIELEHDLQVALRHYNRGGLFGKIIKDSYIFFGWQKTRSIAEFQLLQTLVDAKVNVPKPVAARAVKSGILYRADIICEKISRSKNLAQILTNYSLDVSTYQNIGIEIAKMHLAGVNHTDLNIHNLLIDQDDRVWIIDFDKCHLNVTNKQRQQNLQRLCRSFIKEVTRMQIHWQESDFLALLSGYQTVIA